MTAADLLADLDHRYGPVATPGQVIAATGRGKDWLRARVRKALAEAKPEFGEFQRDEWLTKNLLTFEAGPVVLTVTWLDGFVWRMKARGG
ncbi:MAG: hypothetical protein FD189_1127 [Elusimicrobia bacterium]|nr:MAG: hypothetical protein FD189_1127 [Elusimicrobiota bacterium]